MAAHRIAGVLLALAQDHPPEDEAPEHKPRFDCQKDRGHLLRCTVQHADREQEQTQSSSKKEDDTGKGRKNQQNAAYSADRQRHQRNGYNSAHYAETPGCQVIDGEPALLESGVSGSSLVTEASPATRRPIEVRCRKYQRPKSDDGAPQKLRRRPGPGSAHDGHAISAH